MENEDQITEIEEVSGESKYHPLSDDEVRTLAMECHADRIFGSWMIREGDERLMMTIFLPLTFLDDIALKEMRRDGVVHCYAVMADAMPRGINGYPCFATLRMLNVDDCERLRLKLKEISAAMDAIS